MQISMSMVAYNLKHYSLEEYISDDEKPVLKSVKLLKKSMRSSEPNCVYVGKCNSISHLLPGDMLFNLISIGRNKHTLTLQENPRCNLIIVENECEISLLLNEIQDIFDSYRDWSDKMHDALIKEKGLQYIIDASYHIFNNPIYIIDSSFRTLAYTKEVGADEIDSLWKSIVEEGHTDIATVNAMKENDALNWLNSCWDPIINSSPIFSHPRINANIMNGSKKIGTMIVIGAFTPLEKAHLHMARYLSSIIFLALQRDHIYQNTRGEIYNYFFADLLEGKNLKRKFIRYQLKFLDWTIDDHYFVVKVKADEHDLLNNTLDFIARQLENMCSECRSIIYSDNIVLIINIRDLDRLDEEYLGKMEQFLSKSNLTAGLSLCCSDIFEIRDYYLQASITIDLAQLLKKNDNLSKYEDYVIYHLIHNAAANLDLVKFCHPAIQQLLDYDMENKSDFYNTLRVFITNDRNLVKSAEALFIHRNTLVYRINRITDLTGIDLNYENVKKHILLSYDIYDYLGLAHNRQRANIVQYK
ncbi:MAG: helix-turn-helix domain-containing protein [Bacillota bacterium]|nr:helix-turn-helix domain-containing protein [Bacillota bacterium]